MAELAGAVERILERRRTVPVERAVLVAVSGVDASGKGWLAARLVGALAARGARAAALGVDGWLNLPHVRFATEDPAGHYYRHALRLDAMFDTLVAPLVARRSVDVTADLAEETATAFRRHRYRHRDLDVVVLEGIFLLKREYAARYDCALWVDCTFETALERALARRQEGLTAEETVHAYRTIYVPAQQLHLRRDRPREAASLVLANDPRLIPA